MNTTPRILALDASSTTIGYCLYDAGSVLAFGELTLKHPNIAERCRLAQAQLNGLFATLPMPDVVAVEAPVARFAKALIPQARVSGALMACAALAGLMVVEVTPSQAKRALTGMGDADKREMQAAALCYGVSGEHASDALGIALAVQGVSVEARAA